MWSMILLMSRLLGGHSMSAGRRSEKLGYQQSTVCWYRHYQAIGADKMQRSSTGYRSATRVKGPRYSGASPWMTLYVNTAILNWILSGTRSQWRQASASAMWSDRHRRSPATENAGQPRQVKPNTHRRRDSTVELSRVGGVC